MRDYFDPVQPAETLDEIRRELTRQARQDPLLRECMTVADFRGMNGEDRYAFMAYQLLRHSRQLREALLDQCLTRPPQYVMPVEKP